jgi:hypothetical protein
VITPNCLQCELPFAAMSATEQQLSRICTHCGLCCDGTLFTVAPLTRAEHTNLIPVLDVGIEANGDTVLRLPCPALESSCCTMYAGRPQICREYRCGVLDSVDDGSLDAEQAVRLVSQVRAMARSFAIGLAASGQAPMSRALTQKLREFDRNLKTLSADQRQALDPALLLTAGTLKIMFNKYYKVLELAPDAAPSPPGAADE